MNSLLPLIILAFISIGCASRQDKHEIKQKAKLSTVNGPQALGASIQNAIHSSKHLTGDQKKELEGIIALNKKTAEELSAQSYKFRSVLIEELFKNELDGSRIRFIKKNIQQIERKRLKNTFDTIEKISKIVSDNSDKENVSEALKNFERSFR